MFTDLLEAEIIDDDGTSRRLSDSELTEFVTVLFSAGTETVARHLGWSIDLLDRHPDQRAELAADPCVGGERGGGEPAVRAAVSGQRPLHPRDVTLHDVTIPSGSKVVLVTGATGHDGTRTPTPTRSTSTATSTCT